MVFRIAMYVAALMCVLLMVGTLAQWPTPWMLACCLAALASIALASNSVIKQMRSAKNGISLLKSQDFASRLCKTGDPSADEIVTLFNSLMDAMKAERLKNREQSLFLSKLVEVSPMGIAICNFDGEIISRNPAFERYESEAVLSTLDALEPGSSQTIRPGSGQVLRCSRLWFMDSGFRRPFFLVERLTDEIARAERNVFKKIVRTIGHEVNNTLGSVKSVLETVASFGDADPLVVDATESAADSCDNLVAFVKGYSDVVKLPAPVLEPTDMAAALRHMEPVLRGLLPSNIALRITAPAPMTVSADTMLMERVLVNVVRNAAESISDRPDGLIEISATGRTITVTDNGRGITPEQSQLLFTPFYSTKHPDRGLGLMLVSDILHAHGATFSLATAAPLTTFTINFPAKSFDYI